MQPVLALDAVSVIRGGVDVLTEVHLEVAAGRCTVLVGPSGAGKSTLVRLFDRLEEPDRGRAYFAGAPLHSYDVRVLRRRVGLVQQAPVLLRDVVLADLRVGAPLLTREEALLLLHRVGLPAEFLDRPTRGLSGGEAQRVCLARALAVRPEVLLLDEPTSALDSFATAAVERALGGLVGEGLSVVLVSHDLAQARRLADDLVVLVAGRVAARGPAARVFAEAGSEAVRAFLRGAHDPDRG